MKKFYILIILLIGILSISFAQEIKVLTLGTFHFEFPNADIQTIEEKNQIDVLKPEHQREIKTIVDRISEFNPSIIAIEVDPRKQAKIDSVYHAYLAGKHELRRNEYEQIGFRLAQQFNLQTLYCVNDWGVLPESIKNVVYGNDTIAKQQFMSYFYNNSDSSLIFEPEYIFQTQGILDQLIELNSEEHLKNDLGNYMISIFKYETPDNEFFGVDFTTGWWFNRNLRIFRNIQKIPVKPDDRILVIYGSGHMGLLNIFFNASPEYELHKVSDYLK